MSVTLADLPDDVQEALAPHVEDTAPAVLAAIGLEIAGKRDEAKAARASSGIEATWTDAEEAYIGIDDANRHEFTEGRWVKPTSSSGPVTTGRTPQAPDHKSTVYLRLTSRYVDAGAAKLAEILLPADDKAFSFSETPVPEVIEAKEDESQVVHGGLGVPLTRPLAAGDAPPATVPPSPMATPQGAPPAPGAPSPSQPAPPPGPPPRVPLTVKDLALENIDMARKRAKAAETRIYDWMVECQYSGEMRKVIADCSRLGVGVLKAPAPKVKRVMAVTTKGSEIKIVIKEKVSPAAFWVDPWNFYPDPACGENIHDGAHALERDFMSARQIRALKKLPGYIAAQIDKVLVEGPNGSAKDSDNRGQASSGAKNKDRFEVWYFYGTLTKDEMAAIDAAAGKQTSPDREAEEVHAIVTLINDSVVRATINPLDSGSFPYHPVPWQRRAKHWAGIGVAEQMRTPQKVTNAALRALLNNAGKSADNQYVIDRGGIAPADNNWTITPGKIWYKTADGPTDVRQAFMAIQIPNTTDAMMKIIELGERFAEETTSIPLITQGQSGATTPDTFGAAQLQNNNANQLLRSIGYAFDDYITEPVVRQFYEWLLLDPDVPNEEKGEYQINAHGSIALVERAIQDQTIAQMAALVLNPAYGFNPKKWAGEFARSKRLNPESLQYTPEEQAKIDAAPPPEAPNVTVAKINADTQLKLGVMGQQSVQSEERIEQAANVLEGKKVETAQQEVHVDATVRLHELEVTRQNALLEYANRQKISLDAAKMQLAKTAMQLQTERELNATNNAAGERKHRREMQQRNVPRPPVQAPGRAANGHGFDQAPAQ